MNPLPPTTLDYIKHPTPEGQRNAALFAAAAQFRDAGASEAETLAALVPCGERDGLRPSEAASTVRSVFRASPREPIKSKGEPQQWSAPRQQAKPRAKILPVKVDLTKAGDEIPPAIEGGFEKLLLACFEPGEFVSITQGEITDGKEHPADRGATFERDALLAKLKSVGGNPSRIWHSSDGAGVFFKINPMREGGSSDSDVTRFRHCLVEFDKLELPEQWEVIRQSQLPVDAVIYTGGKSLHALVRVDAQDSADFRERCAFVWDALAGHGMDEQNKNPSRHSRVPGCRRGESQQELVSLRMGAESFEDWRDTIENFLPAILDAESWLKSPEQKPPMLINGLLHRGSKLVLGGGSKSFKSWALEDMACSVATGAQWWGFDTQRARVLYLNFEVQSPFMQTRIEVIVNRRKLVLEPGWLHVWNLRDYITDFSVLLPRIAQRVKSGDFGLIVLDPIYCGLGDRDENKAGDVAALLREVGRLAYASGAAVAFSAHFSKGGQSGKDHADRISGSGVFARDPDSILTMTRHEEDDAFTIECTLRNMAGLAPFVVKWEWPTFTRIDVDPTALRQPGRGSRPQPKLAELLALFPDHALPTEPAESALFTTRRIEAMATEKHWPRAAVRALLDEAEAKGELVSMTGAHRATLFGRPKAVEAAKAEKVKE